MTTDNIRWIQRLNNYGKALQQLTEAVNLSQQRPLSNLEKQGLIQAFEFAHELAWNVIKDYFVCQGDTSITGSRDATREAFNKQLVTDGETWMEMIKSQNQSSHTYNQATADEISDKICSDYFKLFPDFNERMQSLIPDRA